MRARIAYIIGTIAILGTAAMWIGAIWNGFDADDMRAIGSVTAVGAITWLCRSPIATRRAYDAGLEDGERKGYREGRHIGRPVIVPRIGACRNCARSESAGSDGIAAASNCK